MTESRPPLITIPAEAYSADVGRRGNSVPLSPMDDAWLALAHALHRLAQQAEVSEASTFGVADALAASALIADLESDSNLFRAVEALRVLEDGDASWRTDGGAVATLTVAIRAVAEEQELVGALHLAYATLHCFSAAFGMRLSPQMRGEVLAHQGRALRGLGDNERAREHYERAVDIGYGYNLPMVTSRALSGLGTLNMTLGNYPAARDVFSRALADAESAADSGLIRVAHHGLQSWGLVSGDLDSALLHGWKVLRLCLTPETRAEALMNLAEVCRLSGEHDAALRAYDTVLSWTSQTHVRAHALANAAQAALASGLRQEAVRYERALHAVLPMIHDTFTRASLGLDYSVILYGLGRADEAERERELALSAARVHSYHELLHLAEQLTSRSVDPAELAPSISLPAGPAPVVRSEDFRTILRSIKGLRNATL